MTPAPLTLDYWPHPLTAAGREPRAIPCREGANLAEILTEVLNPGEPDIPGLDITGLDITVAQNGRVVPRAQWSATPVRAGQVITARANLRGGNDSNPLAIILTIALLVAAPHVATAVAGASSGAAYTATYVAINVAGAFIINQIAPPRLPEPEPAAGRDPEAYSIAAGRNTARPYQPVMLVLGRHRVFPDLAARPYTDFGGNSNQYLNQLFDFGLGELKITDLRIGGTALDAYADVEREWSTPANDYAPTPLIAGNVDTVAGGQIITDWSERSTPPETESVILDFVGRQGGYDRKGRAYRADATLQIQWRTPGGEWSATAGYAFSGLPYQPLRRAYRIEFPAPGRYEVRVRRTQARNPGDARRVDETTWSQMACFQPDRGDYTGRTRLALRIKATEQLNGAIGNLNALAAQCVPVWRDGAWTDAAEASSNPAALLRWYCRGVRVNGRVVAGVGLADARIDHEKLGEWHERCERLGLECNLVLTAPTSHAEVIKIICQAGEAADTWQTGRFGVVWADPDDPVTGLFGPGNIIAGSLNVVYAAARAADEIAVTYLEPDNDWQPNTVRRAIPGVPTGSGTITVNLQGVTNIRQASREANLIAARQFHHRRRITFDVALEGVAVTRGDVIYLSSDLVSGGDGGRLAPGDNEFSLRSDLALSRPVARGGGEDHLIIRAPEGHLHQRVIAAGDVGETDRVTITEPLPADPTPDWLFKFYRGGDDPLKMRVIGIEPRAQGVATLTVIDEIEAYYRAAAGDPDAFTRQARARPAVLGITITETLTQIINNRYAVQFRATLAVSGDYRGAVITAALDGADPEQVALADAAGVATWIGPTSGALTITAVPGTAAAASGEGFTITHEIQGKRWPPGDVEDFMIFIQGDGTRQFSWQPNEDPDLAGYQIRYGATAPDPIPWEEMEPLHKGLLTETTWEINRPGGGAWTFGIKAVDTSGVESEFATYINAQLLPPRLGGSLAFACPSLLGWPGRLKGEITPHGAVSVDDYTWADLAPAAWDDWVSWRRAPVNSPMTPFEYTTAPYDLGVSSKVQVIYAAEGPGGVKPDLIFEVRADPEGDAPENHPWQPVPDTLFPVRTLQMRWRSAGPAVISNLCWYVNGPSKKQESHFDADTSTWPRGTNGGRLIPTNLKHVTGVSITLQSTPAGWTASAAAKNPPEIQIFNAAGQRADGLVDITLSGI